MGATGWTWRLRAAAAVVISGVAAGCASTSKTPTDDVAAVGAAVDAALAGSSAVSPSDASPKGQKFRRPGVDTSFTVSSFNALTGWSEDDHSAALASFRRSCRKLSRLDRTTVLGGFASRIEDWRPSCEAAQAVNGDAARAFFELAFTPIRLDGKGRSKLTSYYEPELEASRRQQGAFQWPIYAKPPEVTFKNKKYGVASVGGVKPFLSRAQIYAGGLHGRNLEIAYLKDPVDLFFLQIQGSGRLRFDDGTTMRVGFAARNGHPYKSVAQAMIRKKLATRSTASKTRIKAYVRANPQDGMRLLEENPAYVFFRELEGLDEDAGPIGALGVQLTDGRSIAIDREYNSLAAPVWVNSTGPGGNFRKLMVAQDTGSAILGPQRADYYWGSGSEAGTMARRINQSVELTILLPTATVKRLTAPET